MGPILQIKFTQHIAWYQSHNMALTELTVCLVQTPLSLVTWLHESVVCAGFCYSRLSSKFIISVRKRVTTLSLVLLLWWFDLHCIFEFVIECNLEVSFQYFIHGICVNHAKRKLPSDHSFSFKALFEFGCQGLMMYSLLQLMYIKMMRKDLTPETKQGRIR